MKFLYQSKNLVLIMIIVWFLAMVACNMITPSQITPTRQKIQRKVITLEEKTTQVQRETSPKVEEAALSKLVAGNNQFAFDLYQAIRSNRDNLFYSPYSISLALAMTYAGARGDTEQQMSDTLHYSLPQNQLHPAFNAVDLMLTDSNGDKNAEDFKLMIANSLWGQEGYPFRPEFLDTLARNYGGGVKLVNFVEREQSRLTINQWVSQNTAEKIEELIAEGLLTQNTRLVLANAIYFKAKWEYPFLKGTRDDEFVLLEGNKVTVSMMALRERIKYTEESGYQVIELPYKGQRMSMVVFVPAEGQFETIESRLNYQFIQENLDKLRPEDVRLFMPKFEYAADLTLVETLTKMGMPDAFVARQADFSGMDGERQLFIACAIHKAFIAVNETGTEAAAATGIGAEIVSEPITMRVNRPFVFIIRDGESGTILFIGRVLNPSQS